MPRPEPRSRYERLVTPAPRPLSIPFEGRDIKFWLEARRRCPAAGNR